MGTIVAGTDDGIHLLGGRPTTHLGGRAVTALARGAGATWAVADGHELWRGEGAWAGQPVASSPTLRLNCLAVADGEVLAGSADAHLLRLEADELRPVASFDRAEGRERWYTPWGGPPDVRSISAAADGSWYVNVHVGGILRSADGGRTWTPTIDIDADVHQVLAHPHDPAQLLAATARGLADSRDAGRTWAVETAGLHATYCRAVALAGDTVLVSCSTGPRGGQAALYRRPLAAGPGVPFERCRDGLPEWFEANIDTACLDAAGPTVAFGTASGELYASQDAGGTWEQVAGRLPPVRCLLLAD